MPDAEIMLVLASVKKAPLFGTGHLQQRYVLT